MNEEVRKELEHLKQLPESKVNATVRQKYEQLLGGSEAGTAKLLDHCLNAIRFDQSIDITHPDGIERTQANVKPNDESAGAKEATEVGTKLRRTVNSSLKRKRNSTSK